MPTSPDKVPMPARIAARPRDERGYPVPAITSWPDGQPAFAQQGSFRTLICLAERRCTVCGTKMPPGPVYRVVSDDLVDNIALALDTGKRYMNLARPAKGLGTCRACSTAWPFALTSRRLVPAENSGQPSATKRYHEVIAEAPRRPSSGLRATSGTWVRTDSRYISTSRSKC